MSRPPVAALLGLPMLALLPGCGDAESSGAGASRLNVLLIVVDTLRADHLGCYGYAESTSPNLDRLADASTVYRRSYSQAPWTTPSVGALLTSQYPTSLGIVDEESALSDQWVRLPQILGDEGYHTGAVISHHFISSKWNFDAGFDSFDEREKDRSHARLTSAAVSDAGIEFLDASGDQPFFLWLHYFDPHFGYFDHDDFQFGSDPAYDGPVESAMRFKQLLELRRQGGLSAADYRQLVGYYDEEIAFTDRHIGRVLQHLEQLGLDQDTLVIFTADHGEAFDEHDLLGHSANLHDELIRVPLMIRLPGREPEIIDAPVATVDVFPTVLELLGIKVEHSIAGRSLAAGPPNEVRPIYAETSKRGLQRCVILGRYKLIKNYAVPGPARLYDLEADPKELDDVGPGNPEVVRGLEQMLDQWYEKTRAGETLSVNLEAERQALEAMGYLESDQENGEAGDGR